MMKRILFVTLCGLSLHAMAETRTFQADILGQPPAGWTCGATGRGNPKWSIESDPSAPSKGKVLRRWATRPRSGALSTVAAGAPQAHRPYVHSLPGAKRPAFAASKFSLPFQVSAGTAEALRRPPSTISVTRALRQALTRRCRVR